MYILPLRFQLLVLIDLYNLNHVEVYESTALFSELLYYAQNAFVTQLSLLLAV